MYYLGKILLSLMSEEEKLFDKSDENLIQQKFLSAFKKCALIYDKFFIETVRNLLDEKPKGIMSARKLMENTLIFQRHLFS